MSPLLASTPELTGEEGCHRMWPRALKELQIGMKRFALKTQERVDLLADPTIVNKNQAPPANINIALRRTDNKTFRCRLVNNIHALKLSHRFSILIAVFIVGLAIYGVWSFKILNDLKVNGDLYHRIVQGKDLVADILPPPEYILESYLTTLQLASENDKSEQQRLIEKLKALKNDYEVRHAFWLTENLEREVRDEFLTNAHEPAVTFFAVVFNDLIPAVQRSDSTAISAALLRTKTLYDAHRKAIDRVVELMIQRTAADELSANVQIRAATYQLIFIFAAAIVGCIVITMVIVRGVLTDLGGEPSYAREVVKIIASGDLTYLIDVNPKHGDSMMASIKEMQSQLGQLVSKIHLNAESVAASAHQLATSANQVSASASIQSQATSSVAAAVEELSVSIEHVSNNAITAKSIATESGLRAEQGGAQARDATDEMLRIADAVNETGLHMNALGVDALNISQIAEVIKAVADQTNLLALNAAIEAARAGDQGRGFAVVADEVRNLAQRTAKSAEEITAMIDTIQSRTNDASASMEKGSQRVAHGVNLVRHAGESMQQIGESSTRVVDAVGDISQALVEQKHASNEIAQSIERAAQITKENSAAVLGIASAAQNMEQLAQSLHHSVAGFKVVAR